MTQTKSTRQKLDQSGVVAFIVVSTVTIILSLITLGFSVIMGREQRQSIDNELSSQAFYAAESGMNDARAFLTTTPKPLISKNQCIQNSIYASSAPFVKSLSGDYNNDPTDNLVQYTCIFINTAPKVITVPLQAGESKIIKMNPSDTIYFSWKNDPLHDKGVLPLGNINNLSWAQLPSETTALASNKIGLLKISVYPIDLNVALAANTDTTISQASRSYFLYPNGGGGIGTGTYSGTPTGSFIGGYCNGAPPVSPPGLVNYCNSSVSGFPTVGIGGTFLKLTAQYTGLTVNIVTTDAGSTTPNPIQDVQATIDSTGEGNDVLKRIESYASLGSDRISLPYGIQTTDTICKRFRVPAVGTGNGPAYTDDPGSNQCTMITGISP